jgi:hypothetical protein
MPIVEEPSSEDVCVKSEIVKAWELSHPLCLAAYQDPVRNEDGTLSLGPTARKHNIPIGTLADWLIRNKHIEHMKADRT